MITLKTRLALLALLAPLLLAAVACGPNTQFKLPDNFAALSDEQVEWEDYDWKAVSSSNTTVVLRERDNEEEASLTFWVEALQKELTEGRGYTHIETVDIKTRNMSGKRLFFEGESAGTMYHYSVSMFIVEVIGDDCIVTIETAATKEDYESFKDDLDAIVKSAEFD